MSDTPLFCRHPKARGTSRASTSQVSDSWSGKWRLEGALAFRGRYGMLASVNVPSRVLNSCVRWVIDKHIVPYRREKNWTSALRSRINSSTPAPFLPLTSSRWALVRSYTFTKTKRYTPYVSTSTAFKCCPAHDIRNCVLPHLQGNFWLPGSCLARIFSTTSLK